MATGYDYTDEQFPPSLDFRAVNDLVVYTKQGKFADDLKPFYHILGWTLGIFAPKPTPTPGIVGAEAKAPFALTFDEEQYHKATPFTQGELEDKVETGDKLTVGGITEIVTVYKVIKTLAIQAPQFYNVIRSLLHLASGK